MPEHHAVLLPEGADPRLGEAGALWNAAEAAEKRKDAQVARELVVALPADRELTTEDRIELALGGDAELLAAARDHERYLAQETLALSVDYDAATGVEAAIDGRALTVAVQRK